MTDLSVIMTDFQKRSVMVQSRMNTGFEGIHDRYDTYFIKKIDINKIERKDIKYSVLKSFEKKVSQVSCCHGKIKVYFMIER